MESTKNTLSISNVAVVLLVAAIGISLGAQGWNSRTMNFDHINFIWGAERFLEEGALPDRGDVSSYWVHTTPGTAWLMLPGMFMFSDPRLYEFVGSAALYVGTLFGLFFLARMCFGLRCAYLSVLLYALSRSGIFFAGSLWSIGHPFFYVWMVYFCMLWVRRQNPNYLAAALVTWSAGMYVDMVLAPAMFLLPVLWLVYRPKLKLAPLLLAAVTVFGIWYPFLRLEASRNFFDLKSLVTLQRNRQADYKQAWCIPTLVERPLTETGGGGSSSADAKLTSSVTTAISLQQSEPQKFYANLTAALRRRYAVLTDGLVFNFDQMAWTSRAALPLLLLGMITLAPIAIEAALSIVVADKLKWQKWIPRLAWTSMLLAALVNEVFVAHFLSDDGSLTMPVVWHVRGVQAFLLVVGAALLLAGKRIARPSVITQQGGDTDSPQSLGNRRLFALGLIVPWIMLMVVVEPGEVDRYWWLWPLQLVAIVATVTYIPERFGWPRVIAWSAQLCLTLALLGHPWLSAPLQAWVHSGWSGPRAYDIQAADYLASQVRSEGKTEVAIGYQKFIRRFMTAFHMVDPRYKAGAELDMFLKHRYGISNSNQCAEGVSPQDDYRIVQTAPNPNDEEQYLEYVDIGLDSNFHMLAQFGNYQVFKRIEPSSN